MKRVQLKEPQNSTFFKMTNTSTAYQLVSEQPGTMFAHRNRSHTAPMELAKSVRKPSQEDRKKEIRRKMYEELRAVEMERRERAKERLLNERLEREQLEERVRIQREIYLEKRRMHEAKQRAEEERNASELESLKKAEKEQLKQKRLQSKKVMQMEESGERLGYTTRSQKEERQEKTAPSSLLMTGDGAHRDLLTSDLKPHKHQGRKKVLINNWVGEPELVSATFREKPDQIDSTCLLFVAKEAPKSGVKTENQTSKPKESKQGISNIMKIQVWMDKYRALKEKNDEKRERMAEEQYARWTAQKADQASHISRQNMSYTGGFAANRNSILKSLF